MTSHFDHATGFCYYQTKAKSTKNQACVVFIHGLGCSKQWFGRRTDQFSAFSAEDFSWIVPDLLGYGFSRHESHFDAAMKNLTMEQQGRKLYDLVSRIVAPNELVYVIAHSMGGPIALYFIESWLATPKDKRTFALLGCAYAEGNISLSDCFGSGKIARQQYDEFSKNFDAKVLQLQKTLRDADVKTLTSVESGDPNQDPSQCAQTGALTVYASAVSLVAESDRDRSLARCRAIVDGGVSLIFVNGELNRGKLESETELRNGGLLQHEITLQSTSLQGGDIAFVEQTGHGMHYENAEPFWRLVRHLLTLSLKFNVR